MRRSSIRSGAYQDRPDPPALPRPARKAPPMPADPRAAEKPGSAAGPSPVTIAMLFVLGVSFALAISLNRFAADGDVPFLPYVFWQSFGGGSCAHALGRRSAPSAAHRRPPRAHLPLHRRAQPRLPLHAACVPRAQGAGEPAHSRALAGAGDDLRAGVDAQAGAIPHAPVRWNSAGAGRHPSGACPAGEPAGARHGRLGGARPGALALLCGQCGVDRTLAPAADDLAGARRGPDAGVGRLRPLS